MKKPLFAPTVPSEPPPPPVDHIPLPWRTGHDIDAALTALKSVLSAPPAASVDRDTVLSLIRSELSAISAPRSVSLTVTVKTAPPVTVECAHPLLPTLIRVACVRLPVGHCANMLLIGPSGCGKTTIAAHLAQSLARPFTCLSLSGGRSEGSLLGRYLPVGTSGAGSWDYVRAAFVAAYSSGHVILLDELDAADENVLLCLNSALSNGSLYLTDAAGTAIPRHPDTVIVAAANTYGSGADRIYVGRNQLDGATLDRFSAATFVVDYSPEIETAIGNPQLLQWAWPLRAKVASHKIRQIISTRYIADASALMSAGVYTLADAQRSLLCRWSPEELSTLGITCPEDGAE